MRTKHFDSIAIGETFNRKVVTSKNVFVDCALMRESGCEEDGATTYTLFFNGATKRQSDYTDSGTGEFIMDEA